jgi:hypothetical protein
MVILPSRITYILAALWDGLLIMAHLKAFDLTVLSGQLLGSQRQKAIFQ